MSRFIKRSKNISGKLPGTLVYTGKKKTEPIKISLIEFNQDIFKQKEILKIEDTKIKEDEKIISWLKIDGIHDIKIIEKIGSIYNIHPLILEDILKFMSIQTKQLL